MITGISAPMKMEGLEVVFMKTEEDLTEITHLKQNNECIRIVPKDLHYQQPLLREGEGIQSLLQAASLAAHPIQNKCTQFITPVHSNDRSITKPRNQLVKSVGKTPRDHRPMYTQEEADAILYYRDSVGLAWKKVVDAWNRLYDAITGQRWGPRTISGLQSHYYRMLGIDKNLGRRPSAPNPDIGLLKATTRRYWWNYGFHPSVMDELVNATQEQLKLAAKQHIRRLKRDIQREGRRQRKLTRQLTDKENLPQYQIQPLAKEIEVICSNVEDKYHEDSDSSSSNSDIHSASDAEGYETSTGSVAPPPSSHTSVPTSPSQGFDFEVKSDGLKSNRNNLPSIKSIQDSLANQPTHRSLEALSGYGPAARKSSIIHWCQKVETFQRPFHGELELAPLRPVNANRNPMAVSSLLSV
ncbi:hypothetical protein AA313_de0201466 [Arthrobotrys entomopaga]|nr:hypothetical protein AA313_de0201466 [Arthrobotrys entomopaga]